MTGPIATIGDMHTCPMVTGVVPHVGGPIIGPGCPGVTINGKPVALMGDMCTCSGPPDTIVTGCPGITVNGKPIATIGDMTAHGGVIVTGCPGVAISTATPVPPAMIPISQIPFPKISAPNRMKAVLTGKGKQLKEAEARQELIRDMSNTPTPSIFNLQWIRKETSIQEGYSKEILVLHADTNGYAEGETVQLSVHATQGDEQIIKEFSGVVKNGSIDIEWEVDTDSVKP